MYIRIGLAAKALGLCTKTLRRYEAEGKLIPAYRTSGGHRRYDTAKLKTLREGVKKEREKGAEGEKNEVNRVPERVIGYVRGSATKQRADLERQRKMLTDYVQDKGWTLEDIYQDIASGLNDRRAGLRRLITSCFAGHVDRVVVSYSDRLARFGTNILTWIFQHLEITLDCLAPVKLGEGPEQQLLDDLLALMTSFTGKFHRMRRGQSKIGPER